MKKAIRSIWPIIAILLTIFLFYWPFFIKGLLPIPADIIPGVYYPWLDIKYPQFLAGVPVKNALPSDVVSLTYPLRLESIDMIKQKLWPLWNPFILCGTALMANFQSAAFYPLNFIYLLIDKFPLAWSLQIILQPSLGALFLYLFLKQQKLSSSASLLGSILWAFSGFFSLWMQYNTVIHAIIYLPLALYSIAKLKDGHRFGLLFSLSTLFSLSAGNPPVTLILLLSSGLFALYTYQKDVKKYFQLALFFILGLGLSAPLLLPAMALAKNSIRNYDNIALNAQIKFLPIYKLITTLIPNYFGNPATGNNWQSNQSYDNLTFFVGIIPLVFLIYSFTEKNLKKITIIKFFQLTFIASLVLSTKNPLSFLIGNLPFLSMKAMVMTRFTLLGNFSTAIISAFVFDHLIKSKKIDLKDWQKPIFIPLGIIIFSLSLATIFFIDSKTDFISLPRLFFTQNNLKFTRETITAIRNTAIPLFINIVFILLFGLNFFLAKYKRLFLALILVLAIFDQYQFFKKYNSFSPEQFLYPQTPTTDYLIQNHQRFARETSQVIPSNTWMPYNLRSITGYDTLHSIRYNQFISLANGGTLKNIGGRYVEINNFNSDLFNFLGVSHLVGIKKIEYEPDPNGQDPPAFSNFKLAYQDQTTVIFENPKKLPLVFSVDNYQLSSSLEQSEELLRTENLSQTVILEKNTPYLINQKSDITNLDINNQSIEFDSQSAGNSLIVTSTTYDPGWKLLIDNQIVDQIYPANHAFIAFPLPTGKHHITLYYFPNELTLGLKVFFLSLIFIFFYLLITNLTGVLNQFTFTKLSPVKILLKKQFSQK